MSCCHRRRSLGFGPLSRSHHHVHKMASCLPPLWSHHRIHKTVCCSPLCQSPLHTHKKVTNELPSMKNCFRKMGPNRRTHLMNYYYIHTMGPSRRLHLMNHFHRTCCVGEECIDVNCCNSMKPKMWKLERLGYFDPRIWMGFTVNNSVEHGSVSILIVLTLNHQISHFLLVTANRIALIFHCTLSAITRKSIFFVLIQEITVHTRMRAANRHGQCCHRHIHHYNRRHKMGLTPPLWLNLLHIHVMAGIRR